jgi:TolB-like protein
VKLEAPGYMPANITLTNDTSGWFWVNCLWTWACPVLMPIDYFSGSMYKLVPDNVNESLMPWPAGIGGPGVTAPPRDPNAVRLNIAVSELAADAVSGSDASVIANLLRGELVKTGAFNVVEKKNMERILAEQAFQQTGCTAQECAVKLGKLLNVQRMIVGSFGKLMDRFFINIRVVNVETGEAVYADEAKGATVDDIEAGIKAMAGRLAARPL